MLNFQQQAMLNERQLTAQRNLQKAEQELEALKSKPDSKNIGVRLGTKRALEEKMREVRNLRHTATSLGVGNG